MKYPSVIHGFFTIDVIDEAVACMRHSMCMSDPLEVVFANYNDLKIQGYEEVVGAL